MAISPRCYTKILKELGVCESHGSKLDYLDNQIYNLQVNKDICSALKFRILAVSSLNPEKKKELYKKCSLMFKKISQKTGHVFLKAPYYENLGFYYVVNASTSKSLSFRLKNYFKAYKFFAKANQISKKYSLKESFYLSKGWFNLTKAMYYENKYYFEQNPSLINEIANYSNLAKRVFQRIGIKKLIELSCALNYYANGLLHKERYNVSGKLTYLKGFKKYLQEAADVITCNEFFQIKTFYLNYIKKLNKNGN